MGPDEWDALAWWLQRLYIEGLIEEFNSEGEGAATPRQHEDPFVSNGVPGEFKSLGFRERTL